MGWDGGYKLNTDVPPCGQQPNNNNIIGCKTLCVSRLPVEEEAEESAPDQQGQRDGWLPGDYHDDDDDDGAQWD